MDYSIQKLSKSKVEIAFSRSKSEWDADVKATFEKNKHKYSLEGFRKGKVPMNILVNRFGKEFFYEEAIDEVLNSSFAEIVKTDNLDVVGRPEVDIKEVSEDGFKAVITVAVSPEFELGKYKGLKFKKPEVEVTEKEVDDAIAKELDKRSRFIEKDGEVANGDEVTLDYSGSVDGVKFEGGTAEMQKLVIGSKQFIAGFEEQLIGMKKGDAKDIEVKFPHDYTAHLAGKHAVFAVKIHEIHQKETPMLDDEFVKDVDDQLNTIEEYKAKLKADIEESKKAKANVTLENEIVDTIAKHTHIDIPECMIEEELNSRLEELQHGMARYGIKLDDYVKYTGTTVEKLKEEKREEAVRNLKVRLVLERLIKTENLTISAEEVNAKAAEIPEKDRTEENVNYLANQLLIDKLFTFLKSNNEIS